MNTATHHSKGTRGKGAHLLLLFSLPVTCKVLVIGSELKGWSEFFDDCHFSQTITFQDTAHKYDMVLYHSACASSRRELKHHFEIIADLVTNCGVALFFGRNFFSISTLKKLKRGRIEEIRHQVYIGHKGLSRIIENINAPCQREFIVLPTLEKGEEFIDIGSGCLEIPHYWHFLYHVALHTCGYQFVSEGFLFVSLPHALEKGLLMHAIATHFSNTLFLNKQDIYLERFDLRLRGAMVLFISVGRMGEKYIVRLVSDRESQVIVHRNEQFLEKLHSLPDLKSDIADLLPRPFSHFSYEGCIVFVEGFMPGVPAWKMNSRKMRQKILSEATEFIFDLQCSTKRLIYINEEKYNQLFKFDLDRIREIAPCSLYIMIINNMKKIKSSLLNENIWIVYSHGDYGYGNILVDPKTGVITGVIDWDTGREEELQAIDYINMIVQKCKSENGFSLADAFIKTYNELVYQDALNTIFLYIHEFKCRENFIKLVLNVFIVRYISRASQYPDVFIKEINDYYKIYSFIEKSDCKIN
jgi:hypothetical protein